MMPCDLGAAQARRLLSSKQLSVVELVKSCIARAESVNPAVNALVSYNFDSLISDARDAQRKIDQGDDLGVLHGLPICIKDMVDVAGLPTTYGSELYSGNVAQTDDPMVSQLRQVGGLIMGKTNNPEWSAGGNTRNSVYGVTANPFDLTRSAAGSSGGSAVAVACGMSPLATGSDTGGSLRSPAAYSGVVGFRPSPGVVPGSGRPMALLPLSTNGPMARTVEDAALMLAAMIRPDRADPWVSVVQERSHHRPELYANLPSYDISEAKVAFTHDFGFSLTEALIADSFYEKTKKFGHLFGRFESDHPDCQGADRAFSVLRAVLFSGKVRELAKSYPDKVGPNIQDNVKEGELYSALDVADAMHLQTQLYRRWQNFFGKYDFIVCPTTTISPRDWHELYPQEIDGKKTNSYYHWLSMAYASTLAGHPSITLPAGLDRNGLPFGLQVIGRRGEDLATLSFARELETVFSGIPEMAPPKPDIERLKNAKPLRLSEGFLGFA
ncbi:amidase [uncultured Marinobacter sp.]|uniref:amidase n=1 Tax=uncultured Marinobacter sp. TaxID=187379 RepID=UPI0025ED1198|nr:amidase [uncultured Marinobacter sp.]